MRRLERFTALFSQKIGLATMEFLEWVVSKFVGNTVSYLRLAILLIVHAALLSAINLLFYSYGIISLPLVVVLNLSGLRI